MSIITPEHNKLNVGCGINKLEDHWNIDIDKTLNPDQVLNIEETPWPYEDDFFEKIHLEHILQYVGQDPKIFASIIKEMYRVSKDQAQWFIRVPHHRCDMQYEDFNIVRVVTPRTFKMFDQKSNFDSICRKTSESIYGLQHNVDLEVVDANYSIIPFWRMQLEEGQLGAKKLDEKLNTMANVAESVNIFIKVHKPGRFIDWYKTQVK